MLLRKVEMVVLKWIITKGRHT